MILTNNFFILYIMTSNIILYDPNKSNITLKIIELQERIMKSKNDTNTVYLWLQRHMINIIKNII